MSRENLGPAPAAPNDLVRKRDVTAAGIADSTAVGRALLTAPDTAAAKAAVGVGSVDNTADAAKSVLSATKLTTARNINGVPFDGTAGITVADGTKEPVIAAGTAAQYWRGDKSFQALDKTAVGLGNVDNTADASKPVSTATATALSGKEPAVAAGTSGQYYRGDKTFQPLNADAVPDGTTNKAFLATERTKLAGVATAATANSADATLLARANHTGTQTAATISDFSTAVAAITGTKGAANGYASLDGGGKVPVSQLPNSIMEYQGVWNPSSNTPSLADGTGSAGDVYRVTVAGSRNLGSGAIDFQVGDYAIYDGSVWQKADTTDAVATVAGRTGNVVLTKSDVGLGNVDNTSNATERAAAAALTNKDLTSATNAFPTLNQNTTGSAASLSATLPIATGGTGQTTAAAAITALTGTQTAGRYLRSDGTSAALSAIAAGDVPTLNQDTTGTAANVTGTVAAANGGTGLNAPGANGNVLTSNGTSWISSAPTGGGGGGSYALPVATEAVLGGVKQGGGVSIAADGTLSVGGGGSARVTSTATSAVTLGSAANTEYVTYIGSGGSVALPTAVGNTSSYTLKNIDTTAKTIAAVGEDASFASVTALLRGDGDNNSTVFTDSAAKYTWAGSNANVKLSTAVKKFGTASINFAGAGNNASIGPAGFPGMGTADFTIEMWFYSTSSGTEFFLYDQRPYLTNGAYITLSVTNGNKLCFTALTAARITGTTNVTANTWHHAAVSRSAGVTRLFLNGVQEGSNYADTTSYLTSQPWMGNTGAFAYAAWPGYLDEIRITQGVGRYASNFTAPTAEFPLPQLVDGTYPLVLAPNQAVEITSNGSNWSVVGDAVPLPALTSTSTSAAITTLTATSNPIQEFTGTTTHTVRLPSAGIVAGKQYTILNNSTGLLTMQTSTAAQIHVLASGTESILTALVNTPTTAAHWEDSLLATNFAAGKALTVNNSLTLAGTDATTMTFPTTNATIARTDAAQTFTGVQTFSTPVINGIPTGTGVATAATANTLVLRDGTGRFAGSVTETTTAVGTIGATTTLALAGTVQTATLTSNTPCTVTMPAVSNGASFVLYLRQPATGTPTTATFSNVRWGTNGAPVITNVLGRMDILTFFSDGTNWYGQAAQGFQY